MAPKRGKKANKVTTRKQQVTFLSRDLNNGISAAASAGKRRLKTRSAQRYAKQLQEGVVTAPDKAAAIRCAIVIVLRECREKPRKKGQKAAVSAAEVRAGLEKGKRRLSLQEISIPCEKTIRTRMNEIDEGIDAVPRRRLPQGSGPGNKEGLSADGCLALQKAQYAMLQ